MEDLSCYQCANAVGVALDRIRPDVVIAGALAFPSGAGAIRWAIRTNGKVVIMDNARVCDVPRNPLVNWVKRALYREAEGVLLPAPSHVNDYKFWDLPEESMFFGLNAVDNGHFSTKSQEIRSRAPSNRSRLNLPDSYILGVGRQIKQKNWRGLLECWTKFKACNPLSKLELVLVGNGPEREDLLACVGSNNSEIHFRDFVSQEEMVAYYALAEAMVLPSMGETWGLVVNEAMACGLPVIVSKQCGCALTLVRDGVNGWLVDAGSLDSIVTALTSMAQKKRTDLVEMGRQSAALIENWGLRRFCDGAYGAAVHASGSVRQRRSPLARVISVLWTGRYRPV